MTRKSMAPKLIAQAVVLAVALSSTVSFAQEAKMPTQAVDQALRAKLPKEILAAGEIVSVNSGSFPPYEIVGDTRTVTGASADLSQALGEPLGGKIRHETVNGLSSILSGIKSGRYQLAEGPVGDFPEREASNDFVDFVQAYVVFAVQTGHPKGIKNLADTCSSQV